MAKKTNPTTTEEELAPLAAEQTSAEVVTEETPTEWKGQPSRAYRSFAVPYGAAVAESVNPITDGQQEKPEV